MSGLEILLVAAALAYAAVVGAIYESLTEEPEIPNGRNALFVAVFWLPYGVIHEIKERWPW